MLRLNGDDTLQQPPPRLSGEATNIGSQSLQRVDAIWPRIIGCCIIPNTPCPNLVGIEARGLNSQIHWRWEILSSSLPRPIIYTPLVFNIFFHCPYDP